MNNKRIAEAFILGAFLCLGLIVLGYLISSSVIGIKALDRTVTVKGLSEREVPANRAIWPIKFSEADNDLSHLYSVIQQKTELIIAFLKKNGFGDNEISTLAPAILDRQAQGYVREVAEKFAKDSNSRLGKIKRARQGQFSITNRDSNTPYIKKVRVVSTLEYYLSD